MAAWEELAERIRQQIRSGQLQPGDRLPSYRQLSETGLGYRISTSTVRTAVTVLRVEGWVRGHPGVGMFVRDDHPA